MSASQHTQGNVLVTCTKKSQFCPLVFQSCPSSEVKQSLKSTSVKSGEWEGEEHDPALLPPAHPRKKRSQYPTGKSLANHWEWPSPFSNAHIPSPLVTTMVCSPWSCWEAARIFSSRSVSSCMPQLMQMSRVWHHVFGHGGGWWCLDAPDLLLPPTAFPLPPALLKPNLSKYFTSISKYLHANPSLEPWRKSD